MLLDLNLNPPVPEGVLTWTYLLDQPRLATGGRPSLTRLADLGLARGGWGLGLRVLRHLGQIRLDLLDAHLKSLSFYFKIFELDPNSILTNHN